MSFKHFEFSLHKIFIFKSPNIKCNEIFPVKRKYDSKNETICISCIINCMYGGIDKFIKLPNVLNKINFLNKINTPFTTFQIEEINFDSFETINFGSNTTVSFKNNEGGFVLVGDVDILSKICNGVFFTFLDNKSKAHGICMIGKK